MACVIPRTEVVNCLRRNGFRFGQHGRYVEIYRKPGDAQRVHVPKRDLLPLKTVRTLLKQAGFPERDIEEFLHDAQTQDH